jgi:integral membrane protein (TIGR00529 family)
VDLTTLVRFQWPLSFGAILGGALFGLLGIQKHFRKRLNGGEVWKQLGEFVRGFWPVLAIFIALLGFHLPFILVLLVIVPLFGFTRLGGKKFLKTIKEAVDFKILGTIYAVLAFKDIINMSGAVDQLAEAFEGWGVPPIVLFMTLPLIIGYLNGITHAYVSVAFPLLLPFFMVDGEVDLAKVQLAYAFGFIGVIFSPVHLCVVLSAKYYGADLNGVFRKLILPSAVLAITSLLMYYLL